MFEVTMTEVIKSQRQFTRNEVIELMSLVSDGKGGSKVSPDIKAEYESLSDDVLEISFLAELELIDHTTCAVSDALEKHSQIESTSFSVRELDA